MDALILFSHGSLLCGAGEALEAHAGRLRARGEWDPVEIGYLNYSEPSFAEAAARAAAAGAARVIVVPYFLVAGYFVTADLPRALADVRARHPRVEFVAADALRHDTGLTDALLDAALHARPAKHWRDPLRRAAASCQVRPECPLYGTPACPGIPASEQKEKAVLASQAGSAARAALLVMVHGSPRPIANEDMFRVVDDLRARAVRARAGAAEAFPLVEVGFMECNEPSLPDAIDRCVRAGAERIVAVPYFLHTGAHVCDDLPTTLEEARDRHPGVEFLLGDYLGLSPRLTEVLAARARQAVS